MTSKVVDLQMDLQVDLSTFTGDIYKAIADHLAKALTSGFEQAVKQRISRELEVRIRATIQYQKLTTNNLIRGEIGLINPVEAIESILQGLVAGMFFVIDTPRSTGNGITGGADIGISRDDFADVLASPMSRFQSKGHNVDWLNWMLLRGDTIVVPGFRFSTSGNKPLISRTQTGIMVKGNRDGGWSVPEPLGGTANDNWMTQLITGFQDAIFPILVEELERRI